MSAAAFYGLVADFPDETLRQEYDAEAPLPYAIWCAVDEDTEDIVGAGHSLTEAAEDARDQLEIWRS
ncbi:MAG: hypothetical protein ACYTFG_18180 [Planctomycetota bacterium]|jgi:hypothetical protein